MVETGGLKSTRCQAAYAESSSYPVKIAVLRVLRVPLSALLMQHALQHRMQHVRTPLFRPPDPFTWPIQGELNGLDLRHILQWRKRGKENGHRGET